MKTKAISHKNNSIVLLFALTFSFTIFGQESQANFWNNIRFGGGVGLSFGDGFFSGTLAPSALYEVSDYFAMGLGLNATYSKERNIHKSTILGGSLLTLFNPTYNIQISAELEELNVDRNFDENFISNIDNNYWYTALFLGAGYRTGNVTFGIRYDILYDEDKSIYADPWIPFVRVYF